MKTLFALIAALLLAPAASALQISFYPGARIYAYEADGQRGARTLMIHDIGIRNDTTAPVTLTSVTIELLTGDRVLDARTLGEPELLRAAGNGVGIQAAGLWDILAFQFGGAKLLPAGVKFSDDLVLAPGEAIMINSQLFAYRGSRDGVRVKVNGTIASARLPVLETMSKITYQFPLRGNWYNGAGSTLHSHHRWTPMEEFAFDLLKITPEAKTHRGDGYVFTDYLAYGEPVFAAADGVVSSVAAGEVEDVKSMRQAGETVETYFTRLREDQSARLARGRNGILGNHLFIDHGNGEFSLYAHLKPGSVSLRAGQRVTRGQQIGAVGSSGNSTEPHLHFQVCDGPDPLLCAGVPVKFEPSPDPLGDPPRAAQTGDFLSRP